MFYYLLIAVIGIAVAVYFYTRDNTSSGNFLAQVSAFLVAVGAAIMAVFEQIDAIVDWLMGG